MSYLLDTDICIYILNGPPPALRDRVLQAAAEKIHVSTMTEAELYYGALHSSRPQKNRDRIEALLLPLAKLDFDSDAAHSFAEIKENLVKKGALIGVFDMLIAAIARSHNLTLVTNNVKDFERVPNLSIENWIA